MPPTPEQRFTGLAGSYGRARPSYPAELVHWCLGLVPDPELIVDLGCGTGISTRLFAASGKSVIGIDPNPDMLAVARSEGGEFREGSSMHTGLPNASADLTIAGQAFHWFPIEETFQELARIGTQRSRCMAFWNVRREEGPFMRGYEELLRTWSTEYEVNDRARKTIAAIQDRRPDAHLREFPHTVHMDRERVRALALSSSYVKHGVADIPAFLRDLDTLLGSTMQDGQVEMRYVVRAIAWKVHG